MSLQNVKKAIRETLNRLQEDNFKNFCSELTDENNKPLIFAAEVENKSRFEIANLLVSRCTEAGALDRTCSALEDIGCNDEALKLKSRCKPASAESSSVAEPGPAPEPLLDCASSWTPKASNSTKFPPAPPEPGCAMSAEAIIQKNKTAIHDILSGDQELILQKVYEKDLITRREYNNLKIIPGDNVEKHIIRLVDTIINKGEETCQNFLNLLQTDEVRKTYRKLQQLDLSHSRRPPAAAQKRHTEGNRGIKDPKRRKLDEVYLVQSNPRGICLILNNINFPDDVREGSEKDAESLAEVFSWLGFTVLMCEDQTRAQMRRVLGCFSTLSDPSKLQQLDLKVWSGSEFEGFVDLQPPLKHQDAFVCCVLSHGGKGVVFGTDELPIRIKEITRTFRASKSSPLTGKPKVFLIQACQGEDEQRGAIRKLKTDAGPLVSHPEDGDVLVAVATVEDCVAFRDPEKGSWFIQSLCPELREGCSRGDDIHTILQRVNREVGEIEGDPDEPGLEKQMPEIHYTLSKKLILRPLANMGL